MKWQTTTRITGKTPMTTKLTNQTNKTNKQHLVDDENDAISRRHAAITQRPAQSTKNGHRESEISQKGVDGYVLAINVKMPTNNTDNVSQPRSYDTKKGDDSNNKDFQA